MSVILNRFFLVGLALSVPLLARAELQASSGSNSLAAVAGLYTGLMYESNGITHEHSGFFSINLSRSGWVAGFVIVAGDLFHLNLPFVVGDVRRDGSVELELIRGGPFNFHSRYTLRLQFDLTDGTDQVTGTLDDSHHNDGWHMVPATWTAQVLGDRDLFHSRTNPTPQAGTYTLILPGGDGTNEPAGAGYASIRIDTAGNVRVSGSLADGTPFTRSTALAKDGRFALYAPLYGGRGSLIGWVTAADLPGGDLSGNLFWIRPRMDSTVAYRNGFTNQLEAVGSAFTADRNLNQFLNFTNGVATFSDAGLNAPVVNTFRVDSSRIVNTSGNRFSLSISSATGLFRGSFTEPGSNRGHVFSGACLQKQTRGYGYFFGNNYQSGLIVIEPEP